MDMYQHDSATMFQFVLRGDLIGDRVIDLDHAWNTAKSILAGKVLVVDISGITSVDHPGIDLLSRMRESGARLTAALPPESEELLRSLDIPPAAPRRPRGNRWAPRLFRLARLSGRAALRLTQRISGHRNAIDVAKDVQEPSDESFKHTSWARLMGNWCCRTAARH